MKKQGGKKRSRGADALLESLAELEAAVREGLTARELPRRFPARTRVLVPEPREYTSQDIRLLRQRMNVSQGDFGQLLGVSRILVQSWEQDIRQPSPLARRMLDTISRDPAAWLGGLRLQAESPRRRVG